MTYNSSAREIQMRPRSILRVATFCVALSAVACGPCPDNTSPDDGSCTCSDGTKVKASECDACSGSEPVDFGEIVDVDLRDKIISICERSFDFSVPHNSTVTLKLSQAQASLTTSLETSSGVALGKVTASAGRDGTQTFYLSAGTYHLDMSSSDSNKTTFRLELHATPYEDEVYPEPGNDQQSAYPVASVADLVTLPGYVGASDPQDYYSFTMEQNGTFTYALTKVSGSARAQLYPFAPIIDENTPYDHLDASSDMSANPRTLQLEKGDYFVRVIPNGSDSLYELRLSSVAYEQPEHDPEPSDDWTQALDVGSIGDKLQSNGGFVGGTDPGDFYRFDLDANRTLTYQLRNVVGRVQASLYEKAVQIDPSKPNYSIDSMTTPSDSKLLKKGTYYLRVTSYDGRTPALYTLGLSAEVE